MKIGHIFYKAESRQSAIGVPIMCPIFQAYKTESEKLYFSVNNDTSMFKRHHLNLSFYSHNFTHKMSKPFTFFKHNDLKTLSDSLQNLSNIYTKIKQFERALWPMN